MQAGLNIGDGYQDYAGNTFGVEFDIRCNPSKV